MTDDEVFRVQYLLLGMALADINIAREVAKNNDICTALDGPASRIYLELGKHGDALYKAVELAGLKAPGASLHEGAIRQLKEASRQKRSRSFVEKLTGARVGGADKVEELVRQYVADAGIKFNQPAAAPPKKGPF